jgi:transposase
LNSLHDLSGDYGDLCTNAFEAHKKSFAALVAGAVPEGARDKPLELWWQDEARVGQQGTLTYVWAERGSRPRVLRDQRYEWTYLFGAVCPARGVGAALVLPRVNIDAMNRHLSEISRHVAEGHHAVVVLDGAGWHQPGDKLKLPDNISLLHLPPYCPELNPVENIWQFLRQNYLSQRVFDSYQSIVDACCDAWIALTNAPERIRSRPPGGDRFFGEPDRQRAALPQPGFVGLPVGNLVVALGPAAGGAGPAPSTDLLQSFVRPQILVDCWLVRNTTHCDQRKLCNRSSHATIRRLQTPCAPVSCQAIAGYDQNIDSGSAILPGPNDSRFDPR